MNSDIIDRCIAAGILLPACSIPTVKQSFDRYITPDPFFVSHTYYIIKQQQQSTIAIATMTAIATQPATEVLRVIPNTPPSMNCAVASDETTVVLPASKTADDVEEPRSCYTEQSMTNPEPVKRSVLFDKIEIREYSRCMGDNPATTHGPSLSLSWQYDVVGTFDVEEYEECRPERRASQQLLIPGSIREQILLAQTDVTKKQINTRVAEIKAMRQRRQRSVALQEIEDFFLIGEAIARKLRRLRSGVSKKKEQQLLWENARHVMESNAATKSLSECSFDDGDGSTQDTECETRPSESSCSEDILARVMQ